MAEHGGATSAGIAGRDAVKFNLLHQCAPCCPRGSDGPAPHLWVPVPHDEHDAGVVCVVERFVVVAAPRCRGAGQHIQMLLWCKLGAPGWQQSQLSTASPRPALPRPDQSQQQLSRRGCRRMPIAARRGAPGLADHDLSHLPVADVLANLRPGAGGRATGVMTASTPQVKHNRVP